MAAPTRILSFSRACALVFLLLWGKDEIRGQTLQTDKLKASYLVGFLDYARWQGQLKTESATIAVMGESDLVAELKAQAARREDTRSLRIEIIEMGKSVRWEEIDVVFVGKEKARMWERFKADCLSRSILLVGDDKRFLEEGGAIQFILRKNRLRFNVDPENANDQGIELSSKLIELALEQS